MTSPRPKADVEVSPAPSPGVTPQDRVLQIATGYISASALNVAIELHIADLLAEGPQCVADLARKTGVDEDALYRVLRLLASLEIFHETESRVFAMTPAAEALCTGTAGTVRDLARWISDPFHFKIYAELMYSVTYGLPAADKVLGAPIFDYFRKDSYESEVFNLAMTSFSAAVIPEALAVYDFSGIEVLVDVAGGHGHVLSAILQKYPGMRGVLCDLDHVIEGARPRIAELGLADRCQCVPCDFFQAVPPGGDAYIMKHIIHDWDDGRAATILRNIHSAMGAKKGKVILLESVLAPGNAPHFGKFIDIEMLAMVSGRERNAQEFGELFDRAGFRLNRIVPTASPLCVLEAEAL
jgi:hypothetical protein